MADIQPLRYTNVSSRLGRMLLAATDQGVCFLALGDSDAGLVSELEKEFPAAWLVRDDIRFKSWVSALQAYLVSPAVAYPGLNEIPLDAHGSEFQNTVWQELRAIPCGSTRTYTALALALAWPTAVRAVAHACATNPVSILIPCHRMLRKDGGLGGYRWGLSRKAALLSLEAQVEQVPLFHPMIPGATQKTLHP